MFNDLAALEAKVINAHLAVEVAYDEALDHALKAGDFLLEIIRLRLVPHGQKKALYAKTCGSKSTAEVYIKLASHRDFLVEARQTHSTAGRLSIRKALQLIDKNDPNPKRRSRTSPKPEAAAKTAEVKAAKPEAPLPDFSTLSDQEWTAVLEELGIKRFLRVMPMDWRIELQVHTLGLARTKTSKQRLKQLKHNHPHLALH